MTLILRRLLPLAVLLALAAAPQAHASKSQEMLFEAPRDLLNAQTRDEAFETLDDLGVRALRIVLYWYDVAPDRDSRVRPSADLTDPAVYDWGKYAPAIEEAARRGWKVQLTVSGPVPRWATNGARDTVTRPNPTQFQAFVTAVARRFGGQVARWSIWNEPNHPNFLRPQFSGGKPASPGIYRNLYAAALRGLQAAGDRKPVLFGETAPTGTSKMVAPLTFLRSALCLNAKYKRVGKCSRLRIDGYAHHPYTTRKGPFYKPASPNAVTIGALSRLTTALDRAAKAKAVKAKLGIYLTEFGIQSVPDPYYGVSYATQSDYRSWSERIAYENPRVKAFSQYLLTDDDPDHGGGPRYSGFESGLRSATGRDKPALDGFRLPLVAKRRGGKVSLWGLVRPAHGRTTAVVEYRDPGKGWKTLFNVTTDSRGYFVRSSAYRSGRVWRLRWTAPDGRRYAGTTTKSYK
jgi:hypothetical protein